MSLFDRLALPQEFNMKYRIVCTISGPERTEFWKVQKRFLCFWLYVKETRWYYAGIDSDSYTYVKTFSSKEDAVNYIRGQVKKTAPDETFVTSYFDDSGVEHNFYDA